jgi:hypothetical protein
MSSIEVMVHLDKLLKKKEWTIGSSRRWIHGWRIVVEVASLPYDGRAGSNNKATGNYG